MERVRVEIECNRSEVEELANLIVSKPGTKFKVQELSVVSMSGEEFQSIRNQINLTQEEFGRKVANISQVAVSRMERNELKISNDVAEAARDLLAQNKRL